MTLTVVLIVSKVSHLDCLGFSFFNLFDNALFKGLLRNSFGVGFDLVGFQGKFLGGLFGSDFTGFKHLFYQTLIRQVIAPTAVMLNKMQIIK